MGCVLIDSIMTMDYHRCIALLFEFDCRRFSFSKIAHFFRRAASLFLCSV